jgi:hypothetical protein
MVLSALSLLISLLLGFLCVSLFWPTQKSGQSQFLVKCFVAMGAGLGVSSCMFFISVAVFRSAGKGFFLTEIALVILLIASLSYKIRTGDDSTDTDLGSVPVSKGTIRRVLSVTFYTALTSAAASFIFLSLKSPHGGWDAWTIWNLRARFIFRGGDHWTDASLVAWFKPDYPLLIPATIARAWAYVNNETVAIPIVVAMLFTFATVGLIVASLSILRGKSQGFLAGLALLGTPFFVEHGASQYADVPLGFFFLVALSLLVLHDRLRTHNHLLALAGMAAGLAAWTKNEGLLFLAALVAAHFAVTVYTKGWAIYLREMRLFLMGLAPVLLVIVYFKTFFAPTNDLLKGQNLHDTLTRLIDASRYVETSKAFIGGLFYFGEWSHAVNIPTLLVFYALVLGIHIEQQDRPSVAACLLALGLVVFGYFLIYITTPNNLSYHLSSSLNRLLLQLWPSLLFIYFMVARAPETAISSTEIAEPMLSSSIQ